MAVDSLGRRIGGGRVTVSSDPAPAIGLRCLLAQRRARGEAWDSEAFDVLAEAVLRGLTIGERRAWLVAFSATRDTWRSAYLGELVVRNGLEVG